MDQTLTLREEHKSKAQGAMLHRVVRHRQMSREWKERLGTGIFLECLIPKGLSPFERLEGLRDVCERKEGLGFLVPLYPSSHITLRNLLVMKELPLIYYSPPCPFLLAVRKKLDHITRCADMQRP